MLLERDEQLALLHGLLDVEGTHPVGGQVAVVTGPVASGKTELLHTFARQVTATGAVFLGATASRDEQAVPLGVLGQLLHGAELPPQRARQVTRLLDEATTGPDFSAAGRPPEPAAARLQHRLAQTLLDVAEAAPGPLLIGVDDAHLADTPSLRCLSAVTRRVRTGRVLTVLTEVLGPWAARGRLEAGLPGEPLRLAPLSVAGVRTVLAERLGPAAAQRLAPECHALTGGNPALVHGLAQDAGHHRGDPPRLTAGPAFAEALLGCLYRCDPATLQVARAVAVLAGEAPPELVGELAGLDADGAAQSVAALDAAGVLDGGRLRHPRGGPVVLGTMTRRQRAAMHTDAARLLYRNGAPAPRIALQLAHADEGEVPGAVAVLHEAADLALADDAVDTALGHLRVALRLATDARQRAATTARLARTEGRADPAAALRRVPELTAALRAGQLTGRDALVPVHWLLWFGEVDAATDALTRLPAAVGPHDPPGPLETARTWLTCLFPTASAAQDGPAAGDRRAAAPGHPWHAALTAERVPAADTGARAVAHAEQVLHRCPLDERTLAPVCAALLTLVHAGRLAVAESWCGTLAEQATARAAPTWRALFTALRAEVALRRGDLPGAERGAREALAALPPRSWGVAVGLPLSTLLGATTALGRPDEAAEVLLTPVPEALFGTPFGLLYLRARGHHHRAGGQLREALADLSRVGTLMERWRVDHPGLLPWRTDLAQALLDAGRVDEALPLAEEQLARCGPDQVRPHAVALRVLAATAPLPRRLELLRQAVAALQGSDDRLELAHALSDLGLAHRELGQFGRARMMLRSARVLARQCGAASPGRTGPRPTASGEPASPRAVQERGERWTTKLSDAEHRVAVLAASGYSNRQIACQLYVTVSTVEQHLTRIYRKLKVNRRADLSLKLHRDVAESG